MTAHHILTEELLGDQRRRVNEHDLVRTSDVRTACHEDRVWCGDVMHFIRRINNRHVWVLLALGGAKYQWKEA